MTEEVIVTRHDGVMRITMNRPTRKNALTAAMYDSITAALENADSDEAVRAVILEGSGGSFTAGNDLADFLAVAAGGAESRATPFVRKIAFLDTPLIAAVDGVAIGVGTTMLFHRDLVYVTPAAQFRMPFVDLGLVPEAASTLTVPARLGLAKASELLLLGDGFDAAEAVRLGIANALVPASELANAALSAARRLARQTRWGTSCITQAYSRRSRGHRRSNRSGRRGLQGRACVG